LPGENAALDRLFQRAFLPDVSGNQVLTAIFTLVKGYSRGLRSGL